MISSRRVEDPANVPESEVARAQQANADRAVLVESLARDQYHPATMLNVFYEPGTLTNIYEDEAGPIMFVRGCRSLRIDMCFVDNADSERNKEAMLAGFEKLAAGAKAAGFREIITSTNSPKLLAFGKRWFGFEEVQTAENGEIELRRFL